MMAPYVAPLVVGLTDDRWNVLLLVCVFVVIACGFLIGRRL